jgi:DNA recombination protein RmuC
VDTLTIVLIASALVAGAAVVVLLARVLRELHELKRPEDASGLLVLQTQLDALREQLTTSLSGNRMEIDRRLEETNRVVGDVRRGLGEVDRQVRAVSAAARDLRGLQELLRSPTARGGMGEFLLNELLEQVLPRAHFELQHEFAGGERVDAVLRLGDGLVPVDAKFPLENFRRLRQAGAEQNEAEERAARRGFRADVKRHVDAISRRYIRTEEGTFDFALMYIPAEAVYQELLQQEIEDGLDLFHFALQKKVVPVSPQSFYAYLQVILLGLRAPDGRGRSPPEPPGRRRRRTRRRAPVRRARAPTRPPDPLPLRPLTEATRESTERVRTPPRGKGSSRSALGSCRGPT